MKKDVTEEIIAHETDEIKEHKFFCKILREITDSI